MAEVLPTTEYNVFVGAIVLGFLLNASMSFADIVLPEFCSNVSSGSGQGCTIYSGAVGRHQFGLLVVGILALVMTALVLYARFSAQGLQNQSVNRWMPIVAILVLLGLNIASLALTLELNGMCDDTKTTDDAMSVKGLTDGSIGVFIVVLLIILSLGGLMYMRYR